MINMSRMILFKENISIKCKFDILRAPNYYLAENCADFNQDVSSLNYPVYKKLLFNDPRGQNQAYILLHNVGISLQEINPYITGVKLHDASGEIDLFWTNPRKFYEARSDLVATFYEPLKNARKKADQNSGSVEELFSKEEFEYLIARKFQNYILDKFDEKHLSPTNMILYDSPSLEEVKEKQGLRNEDFVYQIVFAYLTKSKTSHVSGIQKSEFTRPRKGVEPVRESIGALEGSLPSWA